MAKQPKARLPAQIKPSTGALAATDIFQTVRPKLMGIAYRFLGSVAEAEDVVQDVYLKWLQCDHRAIDNAAAWLSKVCARRCLDILKSVEKTRVNYVGTWLPEPILTANHSESEPLNHTELAASLNTAFLLALERLSPKERAAFLLHGIFDAPYVEVAEILGIEEAACRQLVSRAKKNLSRKRAQHPVSQQKIQGFLQAFQYAIEQGDTEKLQTMLVEEVVLRADGGGKVPAILRDIVGQNKVLRFISVGLKKYWQGLTLQATHINGNGGFIIKHKQQVHAVVSFSFAANQQANEIFIVRNPDKLHFLDSAAALQ